LFDTFCQQYHGLYGLLDKVPLAPVYRQNIQTYFDSGFLWVKEAFLHMNISAQAAAPALTEVTTEVETDAASEVTD
jgi:hypothetical protein